MYKDYTFFIFMDIYSYILVVVPSCSLSVPSYPAFPQITILKGEHRISDFSRVVDDHGRGDHLPWGEPQARLYITKNMLLVLPDPLTLI